MAQEGRPLAKGVSGEKGRLLVSLGYGLLGMLSAQNQFQPSPQWPSVAGHQCGPSETAQVLLVLPFPGRGPSGLLTVLSLSLHLKVGTRAICP